MAEEGHRLGSVSVDQETELPCWQCSARSVSASSVVCCLFDLSSSFPWGSSHGYIVTSKNPGKILLPWFLNQKAGWVKTGDCGVRGILSWRNCHLKAEIIGASPPVLSSGRLNHFYFLHIRVCVPSDESTDFILWLISFWSSTLLPLEQIGIFVCFVISLTSVGGSPLVPDLGSRSDSATQEVCGLHEFIHSHYLTNWWLYSACIGCVKLSLTLTVEG